MGNDFIYQVETRKIVWLIGLIIASVLIIQSLELPCRDRFLSLFTSEKSYYSNSSVHANVKFPSMLNSGGEKNISKTIFPPENVADISPSLRTFAREDKISSGPTKSPVISRFSVGNIIEADSPLPPFVSSSHSFAPTISNLNIRNENRPSTKIGPLEEKPESPLPAVVSLSEMNEMLACSRESPDTMISPHWHSDADQELVDARFEIEHSPIVRKHPSLYAPIYRNLSSFVRGYEIMEKKLKIYIYKDGKKPVFHQPRLKGIYSSEGWFMKQLKSSSRFLTVDPNVAHLFYLPFSSQLLVDYVYVRDSHTFRDINEFLENYIRTIKTRYPFWNRTDGGDHFLVACHDWAPIETRQLMANSTRALCNSDVKEGFRFGRDVSLPETYIHSPQNPMRDFGGPPPSKRKILAFFAGQMHGHVRPILLQHWENKDPDMKIFGRMRKGYTWHMKNSKYCICAKGYEVNSPRVVEAILYGCVPVIVSDNFVPPFFDVLKWESFAVFVRERDIPNLKGIIVSISYERYLVMQKRVEMVRRHFMWHSKPVKYDIFHTILYSVWNNRVLRTSK
ncbi:Exostosin family protein [Striga hermonthica]|uniref:Exostosin family protein n=1 Tax=Striga hermonthica TaxID=68872 RepID=A0A9N7RNK3_STRHE|nr:Exostosin family protein [Striga hermonthica]